ncbi:hypothetical protein POVCU2_0013950 [Plasmodium ovale curtisi]|uniref:PIR Superfamily Protein n=1 Tax=Plasmodium ovale curtisi TaxID=864141 RepID=A0A1A8VS21_PLAOA|nr:hypothetical protein POVCU2_0013950 [Plasmodium ovale curtisi]SBS98855.1 hypothetical protein POVCU1_049230 [Plasmodium ovale curtisi]
MYIRDYGYDTSVFYNNVKILFNIDLESRVCKTFINRIDDGIFNNLKTTYKLNILFSHYSEISTNKHKSNCPYADAFVLLYNNEIGKCYNTGSSICVKN